MSISEELIQIVSQLDKYADYDTSELETLAEAAKAVGESWSRSWSKSESNHYNQDFQPTSEVYGEESQNHNYGVYGSGPPPANWVSYSSDHVERHINEKAGNPSIDQFVNSCPQAATTFRKAKSLALSFVYQNFNTESDKFLRPWVDQVEALKIFTENDFIESQRISSQETSKSRPDNKHEDQIPFRTGKNKSLFDTLGALKPRSGHRPSPIQENQEIPPHIVVLAQTLAI